MKQIFLSIFSRYEKWKDFLFHSLRSESEIEIPGDRDREVKFKKKENSGETRLSLVTVWWYTRSNQHSHHEEADLCEREGEAGQDEAKAGSKLKLRPLAAPGLAALHWTCLPNFGLSKAVSIWSVITREVFLLPSTSPGFILVPNLIPSLAAKLWIGLLQPRKSVVLLVQCFNIFSQSTCTGSGGGQRFAGRLHSTERRTPTAGAGFYSGESRGGGDKEGARQAGRRNTGQVSSPHEDNISKWAVASYYSGKCSSKKIMFLVGFKLC